MVAIVCGDGGERSFSAGVHVVTFLHLMPEGVTEFIRDLKALLERFGEPPCSPPASPTVAASVA